VKALGPKKNNKYRLFSLRLFAQLHAKKIPEIKDVDNVGYGREKFWQALFQKGSRNRIKVAEGVG